MEVLNSIALNTRLGGGGPNPKILNLFSNKILLKEPELEYLLLSDNKDFEIKAKCWKLPEKNKELILARYKNSGKHKSYNRILNNEIFFKYILIKYKNEYVVFDMEDLQMKEEENLSELDHYELPNSESNIKLKKINIVKKKNSNKGLYIAGKDLDPIKATERVIRIKTIDDEINIRLCKDRKHVINRNSIEIKIKNLLKALNYTGVFIRDNLYYRNAIIDLKENLKNP